MSTIGKIKPPSPLHSTSSSSELSLSGKVSAASEVRVFRFVVTGPPSNLDGLASPAFEPFSKWTLQTRELSVSGVYVRGVLCNMPSVVPGVWQREVGRRRLTCRFPRRSRNLSLKVPSRTDGASHTPLGQQQEPHQERGPTCTDPVCSGDQVQHSYCDQALEPTQNKTSKIKPSPTSLKTQQPKVTDADCCVEYMVRVPVDFPL